MLVGLAGLLLGWVLGSARDSPPEAVTRLGADAEAGGLTQTIPALSETVIAVGTNGSAAMDLALWPATGPLIIRPLPAAWTAITIDGKPFHAFAAFDSSQRYLALAEPVARDGTATLLAGRLEEVEPVATGVTSYVWHTSAPRALAYVTEDAGTFVEVMLGAPRTVDRIGAVPDGAELVAWTDAGFLLQIGEQLSVWPDGPAIEGRFLAAGVSTVLVRIDDQIYRWDMESAIPSPFSPDPGATVAVLDPDAGAALIAHRNGISVARSDGSLDELLDWPLVEYADWSTDHRFVVFADRRDVMILDTETEEVVATGLGRAVAVAMRPLADL